MDPFQHKPTPMSNHYKTLLPLILLTLVILATPANAQAPDSTLIHFEIEDQFKQKHTEKQFYGQVTVFICSDRGGSKFNELWAKAIEDTLIELSAVDQVSITGVANLRGVPFFLKGFIRGKFPKEKEARALMDWKGQFAKAYQLTKNECNVLIFDPQGILKHHAHGKEPDEKSLNGVFTALKPLVLKQSPVTSGQ